MDIILIIIASLLMVLGIIGSFLPILPGPFSSWVGLLLLYFTETIPTNLTLIIITFIIVIVITVLDYVIPSIGTKHFGGTKAGVIGTSIGLVVGLLAPIPGGIIIGPFLGAFISMASPCLSGSLSSIERFSAAKSQTIKNPRSSSGGRYREPGGELLSHGECHTTIVAAAFHF